MTMHNLKTASEFLKCCPETLRRLAAAGKITACLTSFGWRFEEQELVNFVRSGYPENSGQKLRVIDGGKLQEGITCQSINAGKVKRGGLTSPHQTVSEYDNLLALKTNNKRKSCMTA